jgi:hypothetical protein
LTAVDVSVNVSMLVDVRGGAAHDRPRLPAGLLSARLLLRRRAGGRDRWFLPPVSL